MHLIHHVHDAKLSLFQSAVDGLVRRRTGSDARPTVEDPTVHAAALFVRIREETGQPVPAEVPAELTAQVGAARGATVWRCVRLGGELMLARMEGNKARASALEDELKDSECDPGWIEAATEYMKYFGPDGRRLRIPYVRFQTMDDFVYDVLPPNATVAVIGDWGTGMGTALRLLEQAARQEPDAVVHLGDIYYAGTPSEVRDHFVEPVNRIFDRAKKRVPVYALPGNHEMYSGGAAYYAMLEPLNAPPFGDGSAKQKASYFGLRTTDGVWQLLGMDTALHDHDPFDVQTVTTYLEPDELQWHLDKIGRFHARGGRTILLSHHQLFSPYATIGRVGTKPADQGAYNPNLLNAFRAPMESGKIAAWLWGHEHNLAIYEPYGSLAYGRCIGHGAVPVMASQNPYEVLPGLADPPRLVRDPKTGKEIQLITNKDEVFGIGYVLLKLRGTDRSVEISYYVLDQDQPIYVERLA